MDEEGPYDYTIHTYWEKLVADYLRITVLEVEQLNYLDYLVYRRDAFIFETSKTEQGRKYLENAYRLEQTSMSKDSRSKLREMFGRNSS